MERWKGKVAVVTGASSGIGAAISERLVNLGMMVVGIARRKDNIVAQIEQLKGRSGVLYAVKADICKEEDILNAFSWITENVGPIHILINNAGAMHPSDLRNGDTSIWKSVFDTNVLGLCIASREAIKIMRANDINGHIVNIGSIVGPYLYPYPKGNVYPATKRALIGLSETLRQELNSIGSKIKISCVHPGLMDTPILDNGAYDYITEMQRGAVMNIDDLVDAICYILGTPPHVQVPDLIIRPIGELP